MCKSVNIFVFWSYQCCAGALKQNERDLQMHYDELNDNKENKYSLVLYLQFPARGQFYL